MPLARTYTAQCSDTKRIHRRHEPPRPHTRPGKRQGPATTGRPLRDSERNQCVARMRRKILRISEATSTMAARPMHSSHAIGGSGVVPNAVLSHGT